ncbi:hypothetical protein OROGR_005945 [Orobanche gracilis]
MRMRGGHSNGARELVSPDKGDHKKGGTSGNYNSNHHHNYNHNKKNNNITNGISYHNDSRDRHGGGGSGSYETAQKGGSSSGGGVDTITTVWPPKFVIALTNKEKEEDFMAIKGSKLPHRPKKRAKLIQRTLNVSMLFFNFG